jgi:hypothetical protein
MTSVANSLNLQENITHRPSLTVQLPSLSESLPADSVLTNRVMLPNVTL